MGSPASPRSRQASFIVEEQKCSCSKLSLPHLLLYPHHHLQKQNKVLSGVLAIKQTRKQNPTTTMWMTHQQKPMLQTCLFGYFCCYRCRKSWESGYSYINETQDCARCHKARFAYSFAPKQRGEQQAGTQNHQSDKCGACKRGRCDYRVGHVAIGRRVVSLQQTAKRPVPSSIAPKMT